MITLISYVLCLNGGFREINRVRVRKKTLYTNTNAPAGAIVQCKYHFCHFIMQQKGKKFKIEKMIEIYLNYSSSVYTKATNVSPQSYLHANYSTSEQFVVARSSNSCIRFIKTIFIYAHSYDDCKFLLFAS